MAEDFPLAMHREDFALLNSLIYAPQVFVLDVEKALTTVEAPTMYFLLLLLRLLLPLLLLLLLILLVLLLATAPASTSASPAPFVSASAYFLLLTS